VVRSTEGHPTAEWIHAAVRRRCPRVSLGTVYRNLRLLGRLGLIEEIKAGPRSRFDARLDRHHHFTCSICGAIFDLDEPIDTQLEARVAARTGFRVSHHRIEFFGWCARCGRRRSRATARRGRRGGGGGSLTSPARRTTWRSR
jgi:Fe2+ or Zn2+ uptake regulation protein